MSFSLAKVFMMADLTVTAALSTSCRARSERRDRMRNKREGFRKIVRRGAYLE
jgi:hypothetical protein